MGECRRDLTLYNCLVVISRSRYKFKVTSGVQSESCPSLLSGLKFKVMIHRFETVVVLGNFLTVSTDRRVNVPLAALHVPDTFESPFAVVVFSIVSTSLPGSS